MQMNTLEDTTGLSPSQFQQRASTKYLLIILLSFLLPLPSFAAGQMTYIYNAPGRL
jgi:hypothetical protein